jgi:hypothetical protein
MSYVSFCISYEKADFSYEKAVFSYENPPFSCKKTPKNTHQNEHCRSNDKTHPVAAGKLWLGLWRLQLFFFFFFFFVCVRD